MKTMHLPVPLTEAELLVKGDELALLLRKAAVHKDETKATAAVAKERLAEMELEATELSRTIRERAERRPVDVRERRNDAARTIETVRCDTGAVVTSRSMTEHELNRPLFPVTDEIEAAS